MSDPWQFFPCTMGDDRASIFYDEGLRDSIGDAPSLLARIQYTFKETRPDGMPQQSEFDNANAFEDRLQEFADEKKDWYVGRVTVTGNRYFYVYTTGEGREWQSFVTNHQEETGHPMEVLFRKDPEHEGYWDELYPTKDDRQVIKDMSVMEQLAAHGDDGSGTRRVDHWVYFDDLEAAEPFIAWAEGDRFTYDPEYSDTRDDGRYCVRMHHDGTIRLADITSHTIALRRKASEFGGDYDGWTPVMKDEDP